MLAFRYGFVSSLTLPQMAEETKNTGGMEMILITFYQGPVARTTPVSCKK